MEHNRAVEIQAVERYLLGEMPPEEREDFEEHYFTCAESAEDVRAAARFRANARELLRNPEQFAPPENERRSSWLRWPSLIPVAASLLFAGVVWYQAKQQPVMVGAFEPFEVQETTRGGETPEKLARIPRGSGPALVAFVVPAGSPDSSYECTIADSTGKAAATAVVDGKPGSKAYIILGRERLRAGLYTIILRSEGRPVAQYSFQME
jgi:anti-sigma factor RsiW